jgi:DNA-binding beta-propeller fold protein YncE
MRTTTPFLFILIGTMGLTAGIRTQKVDFLRALGFAVNGAGPLLVKTDVPRNRIVLVHTCTSSVSIIDGNDFSVVNIPIGNRIPQRLKSEALAIDSRTGHVYVIGTRAVHILFPETGTARSVATDSQYEMVAVDESTGNAFLTGRETGRMAFISIRTSQVRYIPWTQREEELANRNATPPPPIRKIVADASLKRVFAVDGFRSILYTFHSVSGKLLKKRHLDLISGARWHYGGYDPDTHFLYVAVETADRKVVQAARIDVVSGKDLIVQLPQLTEGAGAFLNPKRDELYIPYDNHPTVHVVDFRNNGALAEIRVPSYGNDGAAIDVENDLLYVSSWAYGEVLRIDLKQRRLTRRYSDVGILPHMFSMAFHPQSGSLFIPLGADAVNGSFGAAVTVLDLQTGGRKKIRTGWSPVDLVPRLNRESFLVFNSEDEFAEVQPDGAVETHGLPFPYPHQAIRSPEGNVYLSYGPHQSYWPVVYIWAAKNGILGINGRTLEFYDRRIPALSQGMVLDRNGSLYSLQNNWGAQKQYLISLPDEIRAPNLGDMRIELDDTVQRETTQRTLTYDGTENVIYIVRIGENDKERGILQVFSPEIGKVVRRTETGVTPTDLAFDANSIYVTNFDSDSLSIIGKRDFGNREIPTGRQPFKMAMAVQTPYVICHGDNTLWEMGESARSYPIPFAGKPDNIAVWKERLWITSHNPTELHIFTFDFTRKEFQLVHRESYPFGDTRFDTANTSFFQRGQFGDAIFEITKIKPDDRGRIWVTDFLSGKLFIIREESVR